MGWGTSQHEGYADRRRADGSWSGPTHRSSDPEAVAYQAACGCGWRSEREHPVPPRPHDLALDEPGLAHGGAYGTWIAALQAAEEACQDDWEAEHFQPLLGYEPHQHLVLGRSDGGQRHFLDGLAVHAGDRLELLCADGHWLCVRYEWSGDQDQAPTAHVALGAPPEAQRQHLQLLVHFTLPARAVLRWPTARDGPSAP